LQGTENSNTRSKHRELTPSKQYRRHRPSKYTGRREWPTVLVAVLTKNDARYLPRFLPEMENLDYPKDKLRWVWLYGKSRDDTLKIVLNFHRKTPYKYVVYEEPLIHRPVRSSLYNAELCNEFKKAYKGEEYVLFVDTDVVKIPRETLKELVSVNKDIVAPYVFTEGTNLFYDSYVFRWKGHPFSSVVVDGRRYDIRNPPFLDRREPVELDSVGTFILIKGEVFKEVRWENPTPHYQFCKNARRRGYRVFALPYIRVEHANVLKEGEVHYPVEWYVAKGLVPRTDLEKMKE